MVGFKNMPWLPEINNPTRRPPYAVDVKKKCAQLGILAFETAKIMSRLISIYKSISDDEISRLRTDIIKSEGVAFLNSGDEEFLLGLACAERIEDLDRAAVAVSRLGQKCNDFGLTRFDLLYAELKLGITNLGKFDYGSKAIEKKVRKMEKLVSATSSLHKALDALTEMEISEKKLKQYKQLQLQKANFDLFYQKLDHQRKEVRRFREISLWSKTFDRSVGLMARIVCVVYARIRHVFRPYLNIIEPIKEQIIPHSGPILSASKPSFVRFYSQKSDFFSKEDNCILKNNRVFHAAGPSTLGGSGLALRYANVILLVEKYLDSTTSIDHDERESLYQMLPDNLKVLVRTKLSKNMKYAEEDELLAEGWREAMAEMMRWLAPMADDTVTWQMERNYEKMKFDDKPTVLLLQTLHFSDKEKTEAAIAEVLVGLSCICRFENRHFRE